MADLWTLEGCITHCAGSPQRVGFRDPRADDSSPEIEISIDRESDSSAESTDQAGAEQSSPAASSPAASSPQDSSRLEDQPPTQAEGNARCPESFGPRACSDNQQRKSRARSDGPATSSCEAMQVADKGHSHGKAAAALDPVPALAAAHAVPALAAARAVPALAAAEDAAFALAQTVFPASQQAGSQRHKRLPSGEVHEACQQTVSMSAAAGRPEANSGGTAAQAHTDTSDTNAEASEVHVKPDLSVSMSTAICNSHESPLGKHKHCIMMGKRKRARKSTKSEHQPTGSVQQSSAIQLQSADTAPKTNTTALFNNSDNGAAQDSSSNKLRATDEVIDLTTD